MTDISTGLYTHGAIMGALFNREKTGRGVKIEANLLSTQVACNSHIAANWLNTGVEAKRYGTGHGSIVPYQAFPTSDGRFLIVGAGNDAQFEVLCQLLQMPELATDSRFLTNGDRVIHRNELIPLLIGKFQSEPLDYWMETFRGCALPYGPVNTMKQVFEDPQVQHNRMVCQFEHPVAGNVRVPGHPVRYSEPHNRTSENAAAESSTDGTVKPAPLLGEHTDWVLENVACCSSSEIAKLREKKAAF